MENVTVRPVRADDAAEIAAIYRPYVENTAITFEYEAPDAREIGRRIANTVPKFIFTAAASAENGSTAVRSASSASRSATAARTPRSRIIFVIFNVKIRLCAVKTCAEADSYVVCNITRCMKNT